MAGICRAAFVEPPVAATTHAGYGMTVIQEMVERSSRRSVPQIFIGGVPIGGYDDIAALNQRGELDPLLFPSGD